MTFEPSPNSYQQLRGARVLVAEDTQINQLVVQEALERLGVRVDLVANGQAALERLQRQDYDAVLMDIQMPVMDGLTATRQIRAEARWRKLPIIALSALATPEDAEQARAAGMNDQVGKPIDPEQLARVLGRWVSPAHSASAAIPTTAAPATMALELPGFDTEKALDRLDQNVELYRRLLDNFVRDYAQADGQVAELLARGQQDEASLMAHRIKGIAATLGMKGVIQSSLRMEAAGRGEGIGEAELEAFRLALAEAVKDIRALA